MSEAVVQRALENLAVALAGSVLHVTLNRPLVRNAMSLAMVAELQWVLARAQEGGDVRVIVLRGSGGHFCAGADLKDMAVARMAALQQGPAAGANDPIAQANAQFGDLCVAYAKSPLAVVAVLEGTVMGGGLGLACVADVALASETAVFRLPETSLGMVPAQIAPFLVERLGYSQAKRLAVTGGQLTAAQALNLGLVHEVHPPEQIDAAVVDVVAGILKCAPDALAQTKALMMRVRVTPADQLVAAAAATFARAAQGPEGMEGVSAFLQKRQPNWAPQ